MARNFDLEVGGEVLHLAGETRGRLVFPGPLQHVQLVFARCSKPVEALAHDDAATRARKHTAAVVRNLDAFLQQAVKKSFAFVQAQSQGHPMN